MKAKTNFYQADVIAKAFEYGKNAFHNGKKAPAQDKNVMNLIDKDAPFGTCNELFDAWNFGFHTENIKA